MAASGAPAILLRTIAEHRRVPPIGAPVPRPESTPFPATARNPVPTPRLGSPPSLRAPTPAAPRYCCHPNRRSGTAPPGPHAPIQDSRNKGPPKARIVGTPGRTSMKRITFAAAFSLLASSSTARTFFPPVIRLTRAATSRARLASLSASVTESTCAFRAISNAAAEPIMPAPITSSFIRNSFRRIRFAAFETHRPIRADARTALLSESFSFKGKQAVRTAQDAQRRSVTRVRKAPAVRTRSAEDPVEEGSPKRISRHRPLSCS